MKKGRILALILSAMLVLSASAGCSGNTESAETSEASVEQQEKSNFPTLPGTSGSETSDSEKSESGTSGSENSDTPADSAVAGKYTLTSYIKDGEPVDLSDNNAKGVYSTIDLRSDGTGELDLFGIKSKVTYTASTMNVAGADATYTLSGDVLTIVSGSTTMIFKRGEPDTTAQDSSTPSQESSQPAEQSSKPAESSAPVDVSSIGDTIRAESPEWKNLEWETYIDPDGLFTVEVPKGWQVTSADGKKHGKMYGLQVVVQKPDESKGVSMIDWITFDKSVMPEPTVECLYKALYPNVTEWVILESSTPDYLQEIKDSNPDCLDAKVLRVNYTLHGLEHEGIFLGFVNKSLISGTNAATTIWAGWAPRGECDNWEDVHARIEKSLTYTEAYKSRNQS